MCTKYVSGNTEREALDEIDDCQWVLLKRSFTVCDRDDENLSSSGYNLKTCFCKVHFGMLQQFADMFAASGVF
jgi:hypothetical protein